MATDFGRDTSCTTSMRTGRIVRGRQLLAEAAFRRITTPPGTLRGGEAERNYGIDVTALVGASEPRKAAARLPGIIRAELLKDERFLDATATVVAIASGAATEFEINIRLETEESGAFTFKVGVDEVSAQFLGIESTS